MKMTVGLAAMFSLVLLMIVPVHADVTSATLDKASFSIDSKFTVQGTVDDINKVTLLASMKGPSVEKLTRTAMSDNDGKFSFLPVNADDLFQTKGIYEITVFTEYQIPENGTVIKIDYGNGIATLLPDYEVILNSIGNKQVDEASELTFTASITDSQVTDEQFSLDKQPNGATINKDTGVFTWTPTDTQSGGYVFDIIVKAGILEDSETITVTVVDKPVVATPPPVTTPTTPPPPPPGRSATCGHGCSPTCDRHPAAAPGHRGPSARQGQGRRGGR